MANVFDISKLSGEIGRAKDKAKALAGEYGLNDALGGHVLPVLPPFPRDVDIKIRDAGDYDGDLTVNRDQGNRDVVTDIFGTPMCFPVKLKLSSEKDFWTFPTEPIISLSGQNTIVRRNVSKGGMRGTIKERWNEDDYSITIEGVLTKKDDWSYPKDKLKELVRLLEAREPLDVECDLLHWLGIDRIVIESFDFPFTKGVENQNYRIEAYSDDNWALLIDGDERPAMS